MHGYLSYVYSLESIHSGELGVNSATSRGLLRLSTFSVSVFECLRAHNSLPRSAWLLLSINNPGIHQGGMGGV